MQNTTGGNFFGNTASIGINNRGTVAQNLGQMKASGTSLFSAPMGTGMLGTVQQNSSLFGGGINQPLGTTPTPSIFDTNKTNLSSNASGLFGIQPSMQSNPTPSFGVNTGGSGLFSQAASSSLFGQPSSTTGAGLFNSTKPQTSSGLFGSLAGTSTFGNGFGGGSSSITGTKNISVYETPGTSINDSQAKLQSITLVPQINQTKTIEELRWEDYQLGGLGSSAPNVGSSLFSAPAQNTTGLFNAVKPQSTATTFDTSNSTGLFGGSIGVQPNQGSVPSMATGLFGTQPTTQTASLFGSNSAPSTNLFGTTATPATGALGAPSLFSSTTPAPSLFSSTTNASSLFGGATGKPPENMFGESGSTFGAQQPQPGGLFSKVSPAGTGLFGGGSMMANPPGATTRLFTNPAATTPNTLFSGSDRGLSQVNSTSAPFQAAGTSTSIFGKSGASAPLFSMAKENPGTGMLSANTSGSALTQGNTSLFGQPTGANTSLFNKPTVGGTGSSLFGGMGTSNMANSVGGTANTMFSSGAPNGDMLFKLGGPFGGEPKPSTTQKLFGGLEGLHSTQATSSTPIVVAPQDIVYYNDGTTSGLVSNTLTPLLFLGNEKAFPSVFRRYRAAALAQVWRPLPEHTTSYRTKVLPSLTPKRFCRPRYSVNLPNQKIDPSYTYDMVNVPLQPGLQSAALAAALDVGLATSPSRTGVEDGECSASRFGSVFRRISYTDEELEFSRHWTPNREDTKYSKSTGQGNDSFLENSGYARDLWLKQSMGVPEKHSRLGTIHEARALNTEQSHWGLNMEPKRQCCAEATPHSKREGVSSFAPCIHSILRFPPEHPNSDWGLVHYGDNDDPVGLSNARSCFHPQRVGIDVGGHLTRRTGRLGLDVTLGAPGSGSLTRRPCEMVAPMCRRLDYSTKPTLETLGSYTESRLAAVEDFTVIREGYGEITWPGITDVRGLCIDDVVIIEDKAVEVYPESRESSSHGGCPPVGVGLNKPALITLYNCGPQPDTEKSADSSATLKKAFELHHEKIRIFTRKMGAQFISLSPQGTWRFRVEHFSRFGYTDG